LTYSALYNPISINIDDVNRVHDSTERNKYPLGTIVILKEKTLFNGYLDPTMNGMYIWLEAADDFTKGQAFSVESGFGIQSEVLAAPLSPVSSGAQIGFSQIDDDVIAGKYFFAKIAGTIEVDAKEDVEQGKYVKVNVENQNVELGNEEGEIMDSETLGGARTSYSNGKANILVIPNRLIELKQDE
jgi:hypothetical protein